MYDGMLDQLSSGNVTEALLLIDAANKAKYSSIFTDLSTDLASLVDGLRDVHVFLLGNDVAEYALVRSEPGGQRAYLIYMQRGGDSI